MNGQLNVAPVPGLAPSAAVPGVYQPPQTNATGSSVTASPDIVLTGSLSGNGDLGPVALSGRAGAGFQINTPYNATLYPYVSYDGGTTYALSRFIKTDGSLIDNLSNAGGFGSPSFTGSILLFGGATHAKVTVSGYVSGTPAWVLSATAVASSSLIVAQGPNVVTFGNTAFAIPLPMSTPMRLGGTPFTLRAAGAITPPAISATLPPQPVMTFAGVIPGVTVKNYVLDAVVIRILGAALTPSSLMARVVKRHVLYASTQTAAPAAGAVPTGAALAYTGAANGGGTYQYKYVAVDIWGNEGNYSAASLNVAPAANNGVTVTCPAVPAGAAGYNIYRTVTGPGATWFFIGRTNTTTFEDITPDSALTLAAGTIAAWGTLPTIEAVTAPMELVMEKFVALTGTAPIRVSTKTFPGTNGNNRVVTIAPGAAVGRYRIPGQNETKAFLATPTITTALARDINGSYTYGGATQINAAFGDLAVNSFNQSDAGMGGTFVVWGHELVGVTDGPNTLSNNAGANQLAGFTEGSVLTMKWVAPPVFSAADEIAIELGTGATSGAITVEVVAAGRYF